MRTLLCSLAMVFLIGVCAWAQPTPGHSGPAPGGEVLAKWRAAVHRGTAPAWREAAVTTASNEDGVPAVTEEWISDSGDDHVIVRRGFDTTEATVSGRTALRRDWNGFLRTFRGNELSRYRSAVFERRVALFGPPDAVPAPAVAQPEGDSVYVLPLVSADGDTTTWRIDRTTWLPRQSFRSGEEDDVVTTYSDWRATNGLMIPHRGLVQEPDKPDYTWERTRIETLAQIAPEHFQPPAAGAPDTYMDAVVPPIPFNFENNHIIFPLSINGRDSVLFLLDTGADQEVINEPRLGDYRLEPYGKTITTGGGGAAEYGFARGATFRLPGVELRNQHVAVIDESGLERALGMKLGGILGYDFISRFVIEIDYARLVLILHDPASWTYTGTGYVVPVMFDNGLPFCHAVISVPTKPAIPAYMVLDFGAAETMTLTSPFVKANDLLALAGTNVTVNKLAGLENQFFSQNNVRGRIEKLTLGGLSVSSFPANLSVNTKGAYASTRFSGTVGQGIYRRYHVFLDYQRDRIIFEPTPETDKPYPERLTYGLTIIASGQDLHTYTVTGVRAGAPAEKDGFQKGDVITGVDGTTAAGFTLGGLRAWLLHNGEHHEVKLLRGTQEITVPVDVRTISIDAK